MTATHARARVLVVDHDRDARAALATALETEGYRVIWADNGAQGLVALLHHAKPDAILLDLPMPVMTGWELLELVHEHRQLRDIPVVVLSAMRAPKGVEH